MAQEEAQYDFVIQIWDQAGARLFLSHPHSALPGFAQLGFATMRNPEGQWRTYSYISRDRIIQAAQPIGVRERLAAGVAVRLLLPFLVVTPVLGLLVWLAINRGLLPLDRVAGAVAARNPDSLEKLSLDTVPVEMHPLVVALNDLLERLSRALDSLKAFSADAAHELRTPLAALQLQVQLVERSHDDAERAQAMARLKAGLRRATHVVEQLLTLARQEGMADRRPEGRVDLVALTGEVMAGLLPLAQDKGIDLGLVSTPEQAEMNGDRAALGILLSNLVDNALRHTPAGGRVDLSLDELEGGFAIRVTDTGPGIPAQERQRVFDRFYRGAGSDTPGSGLGLAIVRRIAERHGAVVTLTDNPQGSGLKVEISFPQSARPQDRPTDSLRDG
jgi:two-component system OmpR family sensor kinase